MSDQPKVQNRNADMVDLLSTDFVKRNEPNYAWKSACSAVLALPALRAFWPMSSVDYTTASRARDVAGGGYHLSDNNTVTFGSGQGDAPPNMVPYAAFVSASTQYLSRADGGAANWADIRGTEAYVVAAQRGLTFGGWFYFNNAAGSVEGMIAKWDSGANRSYRVRRQVGGDITSIIYDGAATYSVIGAIASQATWFFSATRYTPSTSLDCYVNDVLNSNIVGIPASIADSNTQFTIGAESTPTNYMNGRASLCFLCAAALSDSIITALYQNTRKAFNV